MRNLLVLAAVLGSSAVLSAQSTNEYFMYGGIPGTGPWEIRRAAEGDGNNVNFFTGGNEWLTFAEDGESVITFVEDLRFNDIYSTSAIYGIGGSDVIFSTVDTNGDGDAEDAGEIMIYADPRSLHGVTNMSPDGLDFDPTDGALYMCDDLFFSGSPQPGNGITRMTDTVASGGNGNGTVEASEWTHFFNGTAIPHTVNDDKAGVNPTVSLDITDLEAITVLTDGTVLAFDQQALVIFAFQDQNNDGDAMDAGEVWNYCNLIGETAGFTVNTDVSNSVLINPSCAANPPPGLFGSLEGLDVSHGFGPMGADILWIGSTASATTCVGANGLVFRAIDTNNDGDCNDADEVTLWLDGPNSGMSFPATNVYDVCADDDGCAIFNSNGPFGVGFPQDSVWQLIDIDNDNRAESFGEQHMKHFWEPDGSFAVSLTSAPEGAFFNPLGDPCNTPFVPFGAGEQGSNGNTPSIGLNGTPTPGGLVDVTLTGGPNSQPVVLLVGFSNTVWMGTSLPAPIPNTNGSQLYVSVDFQFNTMTNPSGDALFSGNIPLSFQQCDQIFIQWYCIDPAANPRGAITSDAGEINIQ